jgi:hypothetical protein
LQLLAGEEERRIGFNVALDIANRKLDPLFKNPEMENFGKTVHELLENPIKETKLKCIICNQEVSLRLDHHNCINRSQNEIIIMNGRGLKTIFTTKVEL